MSCFFSFLYSNCKISLQALLGKIFMVVLISKCTLENMGEEEQYYIKEPTNLLFRLKYEMWHRRLKKPIPQKLITNIQTEELTFLLAFNIISSKKVKPRR